MRKATLPTLVTVFLLALVLASGCGGDHGTSPAAGTGQIRVNLIDGAGDYQQVNVEIVRVAAHMADVADSTDGWVTLSEDTTRVDLLTLVDGVTAVLADSTLPAGNYTQLRLVLGPDNSVMIDSTTFDLQVPSGLQTGLKLNHPFAVEDSVLTELTLDFKADQSIHVTGTGEHVLKPVIRIMTGAPGDSMSAVADLPQYR